MNGAEEASLTEHGTHFLERGIICVQAPAMISLFFYETVLASRNVLISNMKLQASGQRLKPGDCRTISSRICFSDHRDAYVLERAGTVWSCL